MATAKLTKAQSAELQKLLDAYECARSTLREYAEELREKWETAYDDRSDNWRESDAGTEASERLENFRSMIEEIPEEAPSIDVDALS